MACLSVVSHMCHENNKLIFSVNFFKFSAKGSQIVLPDDDLRGTPLQTACKQRISLQGCSTSMCLSNTAGYVSGFERSALPPAFVNGHCWRTPITGCLGIKTHELLNTEDIIQPNSVSPQDNHCCFLKITG